MRCIHAVAVMFMLCFPLSALAWGDVSSDGELDMQRMKDRIERMQKDLNEVQKQVYRGGDSGSSSRRPANNGDEDSPQYQVQSIEIDEQMRALNGRIEEVQNSIRNVSDRLDKVVADMEYRMSAIEKNTAHANANPAENGAVAPIASGQAIPQNAEQKLDTETGPIELGASNNTSGNAAISKNPTVISVKDAPQAGAAPAETPAAAAAAQPKELDASKQYDNAFALLRKSKYSEAEQALKQFISENKDNELVGNAYYWLGETYYVREQYQPAAVNFLKGYKDFPQGAKVADNLLKLGMSLARLNKKQEACTTFSKVVKEFPKAEKDFKKTLESEKALLKC